LCATWRAERFAPYFRRCLQLDASGLAAHPGSLELMKPLDEHAAIAPE
jgi:hypothetical protein